VPWAPPHPRPVPLVDKRRAERRDTGPLLWLGAVVAALIVGAVFLWTRDTRRGARGPEYSVRRTDDVGAAVAYRLYEHAGLKPRVWDETLTHLRAPGLIIFVAPARPRLLLDAVEIGSEGAVLPDEVKALDAWVRQGNVAVVLSRQPNDLFQALGLIVDEPKSTPSAVPTLPTQASVLALGVNRLQMEAAFGFKYGRVRQATLLNPGPALGPKPAPANRPVPARRSAKGPPANAPANGPANAPSEDAEPDTEPEPIDAIPAEQWVELFTKTVGTRSVTQVVSAARGKGLYVAVNDAYPATNLGMTAGDNARFVLNLARLTPRGGTVWFDEFHKREVERGIMAYLQDRALFPIILYAALMLGLLFWRTGARFGAPEPLVADRRRDSGDYIRAVAALYRNAGMSREALSVIYADFRRRLAGEARGDTTAGADEAARRYELRTGRPAAEAREILIQTEAALGRPQLPEEEALHCCARLTQLDQALHTRTKPND
jgi:hypothetical protein